MTFTLKKIAAAVGLASALVLTGCGQEETVDLSKVKIGVMAGAEEQIAEVAAKVAKEKYGLDVELVTFTDYVSPNAALEEAPSTPTRSSTSHTWISKSPTAATSSKSRATPWFIQLPVTPAR